MHHRSCLRSTPSSTPSHKILMRPNLPPSKYSTSLARLPSPSKLLATGFHPTLRDIPSSASPNDPNTSYSSSRSSIKSRPTSFTIQQLLNVSSTMLTPHFSKPRPKSTPSLSSSLSSSAFLVPLWASLERAKALFMGASAFSRRGGSSTAVSTQTQRTPLSCLAE